MPSEFDTAENPPLTQVGEAISGNPSLDPDGSRLATEPFAGGYYWFPTPGLNGIAWSIVTCRDLGCDDQAGHYHSLWPRLMTPLASAWGKNERRLRKRLAEYYTGLPRGRVTWIDKRFLIFHGHDSPVPGFRALVVASFRLAGQRVKFTFDEHETMIEGDPQAVEAALGHPLQKRRKGREVARRSVPRATGSTHE